MAKVINAWATEWTQRDAWAAGGTQREREGPIRIGHSDTRLPMAKIINAWAIECGPRGMPGPRVEPRGKEKKKKLGSLHGEENTLETLGPIRIGHSDTRLPMAKYWMCIK